MRQGLCRGDAIEEVLAPTVLPQAETPHTVLPFSQRWFLLYPTLIFVSFPSPAWGWTPWCHKRHAKTRGFPILETNPKLLPPGAKHRLRKICLVTPSYSVQAPGHSVFQLQTHFLSEDSMHLLSGYWGMAFPPPPSGVPRQKAQAILCAEPQAGQDRPVGTTSQLHSALLLSVLVLGHNSVLFTELCLCTALCRGLRGRR